MKKLYVVCNDFQDAEECVCCVCGSKEKAENKIEEYKHNFEELGENYTIPHFWIRTIPAEMNAEDCIEFA